MPDAIYRKIAAAYGQAARKAPGLKARFDAAGLLPAKTRSLRGLSRPPGLKKKQPLGLPRGKPPF